MDIIEWLLIIIGLSAIIFYYGMFLNQYFQRHSIISVDNPIPFLGNMKNVFLGKEHLLQTVYKAYNTYSNERYIGFYAFNIPTLIIKDAELIKKITVKDFDHFIDHKVFMDEDDDPLFGRNLFFLRGQKWRDMRLAMSPAYTGSKMKNMFPLIIECAEQLTTYFQNQLKQSSGKENYMLVEMKDIFTRFTNDVIASTAFGVTVNSFENKENIFYLMGKKATDFSGIQFFKFFAYSSCPKLMKFLGIPLFPKDVSTFFRKLIKEAIETREKHGIVRYDMIHLLMLAKKGSLNHDQDLNNSDDLEYATSNIKESTIKEEIPKREWTHDDLTAQAVAFLLAGFDTSSSLLCFTAYELALNTDIQKKLQQEIDDTINETKGKLSYNDLQKMQYMDMVVSESLRMWPPDSQLERVCVKTYKLPTQNNNTTATYEIKKGDDLWIPTYSIHHDPKYHPEPEKFNPERFSDENKQHIHPCTFIPFGSGPRLCIGARFAVMEAKTMIFYLLSKFDIITVDKTVIPLKLAANTFTLHSENGFWLGLRSRVNT